MVLQAPLIFLIGSLVIGGTMAENVRTNDGSITFMGLPEGDSYHGTGDVTADQGFTLTTTWNIIDGFLKMISPAGPPYELITQGLQEGFDLADIQQAIPSLQGNFLGFVILFIIGLVFTVLFSLFLLIFCCCRCCGYCGGRMEQKNSSKFEMMRYVYTLILLITLFFIVFGAITALSVSGYTSHQVSNLPTTIDNNIEDLLTYVNNTLDEINFLVGDQLSWTTDQILADVADAGRLVGVPIQEKMGPTIMPALDALKSLDQYINNTLASMTTVNSTQGGVEVQYGTLLTNLTSVYVRLNHTCVNCSDCCNSFDYAGLTLNVDYRDIDQESGDGKFPQTFLDGLITRMEDIVAQGLHAQANDGETIFEDIPNMVANITSSAAGGLNKTFSEVQSSIKDAVNEGTSQISSLDAAVADVKQQLDPFLDMAVEYDQYRDTAMTIVFGFILLIAGIFLIGVALGVIGHFMSGAAPASRSGLESSGGCIIIIAAFISALLVIPFMMISSFTFIIGGPVDRLVCDSLISKEIFTETIDKPDTIVDGYFLGSTIFQDPTINLTVSGLLNDCQNNKGIYTAFQLGHLLNISAFTNLDLGDARSQFSNVSVDFSSFSSLLNDTVDTLQNASMGPINNTPWDSYQTELSKNVTNDASSPNDLSVLATAMRTAADNITSPDNVTIRSLADELENIQTKLLTPLITNKNLLQTQLYQMINYTAGLDAKINETVKKFSAAQTFLLNVSSIVNNDTSVFGERVLGYPEQFVEYAENQIRNEVGRCAPVYNLYSSSVNTFCIGFIQAFNGFWYCLGLCCFMMIFAFAFGVKSAKYYRKMKRDFGFEKESMGLPLNNRVAPEEQH